MAKIEQRGLQHVVVESEPEPVTRDQVERIVCALLSSPKQFATDGKIREEALTWPALVAMAENIAKVINARNFPPGMHEQYMRQHLLESEAAGKLREEFQANMRQAAAMAEKEFIKGGRNDG